jgi:hypothetical protein
MAAPVFHHRHPVGTGDELTQVAGNLIVPQVFLTGAVLQVLADLLDCDAGWACGMVRPGLCRSAHTAVRTGTMLNNGAAGVTTVPEGNYLFMVHVYAEYFAMGHFGYASALLWFLFLVVLVITGIVFKIGRRSVFYAVDPDDRGNRKERA